MSISNARITSPRGALGTLLLVPLLTSFSATQALGQIEDRSPAPYFASALVGSEEISIREARRWISINWDNTFLPYFAEVYQFGAQFEGGPKLRDLLIEKIGRKRAGKMETFLQYLWNLEIQNTPSYSLFKQWIHRHIDPRFVHYFDPGRKATIRLHEVTWGGVVQDGIPPLHTPMMLSAEDAEYLEDSNIVFGISINGDSRAYPKRILAWHEMFTDTVGGVPIAGVYCTLCGSVVIYETQQSGIHHELGTSGFLYRSNKLMFDQATQSLWSTLRGEPVIGPLVGQGIQLKQHPVVSTNWVTWKEQHPNTRVLDLHTGHERDYGEGVAYKDYFSHDHLMFFVPSNDKALKNKDEVLALRFGNPLSAPVAISIRFLNQIGVYQSKKDSVSYVAISDPGGAVRVYELDPGSDTEFQISGGRIYDQTGAEWTFDEVSLRSKSGIHFERLSTHRAFWFGWKATFPETMLIQ